MTARYSIAAYPDWNSAEPSYRGTADSLAAACYVASYLAEPLIDVIETEYRASGRPTRGGNVVAVRRTLRHPAQTWPFEPRDDFGRADAEADAIVAKDGAR